MNDSSSKALSQIKEFKLVLDDLNISSDKLLKMLGYSLSNAPEQVSISINKILDLFGEQMVINCGYKIFQSSLVKIDKAGFSIGDVYFDCDKIIAQYLKSSESLIFIVVTLGDVYERLFDSFKSKNDYLEMYLVDKMASDIVESAADKLEKLIEENLASTALKITNRYSPGYCGWNVSEQKKLFSLLPNGFCGVSLNESAMMIPVKSISAVIGIGINAERQDYNCSICDDEFCYKRKNNE